MVDKKEMSSVLKSFLIHYGFNSEDLNACDDTPMRLIIQVSPYNKYFDQKLSIIKELIYWGADVNLKSEFTRESNLHLAITNGDPDVVEVLCENRADVNCLGKKLTPFELASSHNYTNGKNRARILNILLKNGAKVSKEDASEISFEELEKIYNELYLLIDKEFEKSKKIGKKFVLLLGEGHELKHSLLIEIMILNIAHQLGIDDLILEVDNNMLKGLKATGKVPGGRSECLIMQTIYSLAHSLGMTISAGDPEHEASGSRSERFAKRDKGMSQFVRDMNVRNAAIFIVGSEHLKGLLEDYPLDNTFHVTALNTYPLADVYKDRACATGIVDIPYLKNPKIYQFFFSGSNPELWEDQMILDAVNRVIEKIHPPKIKQRISDVKLEDTQGEMNMGYLFDAKKLKGSSTANKALEKSISNISSP